MAAHSCPALPVPAVTEIGRAEIGPTRIAVYFAVSERAPGRILNDLDAAGLRAVLPGLLTALDAARDIDVTGSGGYGLRDPGGRGPYLTWPDALLACNQETERIPSWRAALERSPVGSGPFDEAYGRLQRLVEGLPEERHVIHGDLANRNVLALGADITAVIDRGNSIYGDYLYDAAWLIYWWR